MIKRKISNGHKNELKNCLLVFLLGSLPPHPPKKIQNEHMVGMATPLDIQKFTPVLVPHTDEGKRH